MNPIVAIHEPVREYIYPVERNRLVVKLKAHGPRGARCRLHAWNRFCGEGTRDIVDMPCYARDDTFDHFKCELAGEESFKYLRYYFEIAQGSQTYFMGAAGITAAEPAQAFEYLYTNENDIFEVPGWAKGAVLYQIFPDRFFNGNPDSKPASNAQWGEEPNRENIFGGDIAGIISKVDYLTALNIEALYLNPIFLSPSNHKYDTTDYYTIDPGFGTLEEFKKMVRECHKRGIHVILDGVFNHCGYGFHAFQDVLEKGRDSRYLDWFYIDSLPIQTDPPNYECVGYYKWMPKLRLSNREVRKYLTGIGTYWIREADIDGWRLDVADEVDFTFWEEFRRAIKAEKKDAILIGETWKDGRDMLRGDQMDSVMNYLFRDAVCEYFAEGKIGSQPFDHRIQKMLTLYPDCTYASLYNLIGSHDTPRFLHLCKGEAERLKLAAAFQMAFPGMPAIYYGDETGLDGANDPGCRKTMNWESMNKNLLQYYRKLTSIRKDSRALRYGDLKTILCSEGVYGFTRSYQGETVIAVFNNSDSDRTVDIPLSEGTEPGKKYSSLLNSKTYEPIPVKSGEAFYNGDLYHYRMKFSMVLPAYQADMIT